MPGVGLVQIDQQWNGAAGVGEAAQRVGLQAGLHRGGLCFDGGELLLGLGDLHVEGVEAGLRVECRLGGGVGAIPGGLDLLGGPHRGGVLGARRSRDDDRPHQGEQDDGHERGEPTCVRCASRRRHGRRAYRNMTVT